MLDPDFVLRVWTWHGHRQMLITLGHFLILSEQSETLPKALPTRIVKMVGSFRRLRDAQGLVSLKVNHSEL